MNFRTLFVVSVALTVVVKAADVCNGPFTDFLQCMADETDKKLATYIKEVSPEVKNQMQKCFTTNSCQPPDFSKATVENFFKDPWTDRVNNILALLENVDPKVKTCMIRYFTDLMRDNIDKCVKENGPSDVKDFEMPPIPDIHNVDISKFKEIVLNRMVVRLSVVKCGKDKGSVIGNKTVDCIADARHQHDQTMCNARESCRDKKIPDSKCRSRFDEAHQTACKCLKDNKNGPLGLNLKQQFLTGKIQQEFKHCHDVNHVPYPQDKMDKVKQAITEIMSEVIAKHQIPPEVKQTVNIAQAALKDVFEQFKGAFCAECSASGDKSTIFTDDEVAALKNSFGN